MKNVRFFLSHRMQSYFIRNICCLKGLIQNAIATSELTEIKRIGIEEIAEKKSNDEKLLDGNRRKQWFGVNIHPNFRD